MFFTLELLECFLILIWSLKKALLLLVYQRSSGMLCWKIALVRWKTRQKVAVEFSRAGKKNLFSTGYYSSGGYLENQRMVSLVDQHVSVISTVGNLRPFPSVYSEVHDPLNLLDEPGRKTTFFTDSETVAGQKLNGLNFKQFLLYFFCCNCCNLHIEIRRNPFRCWDDLNASKNFGM